MNIHLGFQENFGTSRSGMGGSDSPFMSFAAKISIATQIKFRWDF